MRVRKIIRNLAADICSLGATEVHRLGRVVFLTELWWTLDDQKLDLVHRDQVEILAALAFRDAQVDVEVFDEPRETWRMWELQYAEAAAMLREGWSPKGES